MKKCKFKIHGFVCSECEVHCFEKEKRVLTKEIMRYSYSKMIFKHPFISIRYLINKLKSKIIKKNYLAKNKKTS